MTAPSPAGLSPLLDQLDEARERIAEWLFDSFFGDEAELPEGWLEDKADALLSGPLAPLTAAIRAVIKLTDEWDAQADRFLNSDLRRGAYIAAASGVRTALTAALTPGADTAGATA